MNSPYNWIFSNICLLYWDIVVEKVVVDKRISTVCMYVHTYIRSSILVMPTRTILIAEVVDMLYCCENLPLDDNACQVTTE